MGTLLKRTLVETLAALALLGVLLALASRPAHAASIDLRSGDTYGPEDDVQALTEVANSSVDPNLLLKTDPNEGPQIVDATDKQIPVEANVRTYTRKLLPTIDHYEKQLNDVPIYRYDEVDVEVNGAQGAQ